MRDERAAKDGVFEQYQEPSRLEARLAVHRRFSTNRYGFARWALDQLELSARCRVLELGCGNGNLWAQNAERAPPGCGITLSDLCPKMVQRAHENVSPLEGRFAFAAMDAESIGLADHSSDIVVANHMLFHVADRPTAFSEICRVLTPRGRLHATANGLNHLRELAELAGRFDIALRASSNAERFGLENGAAQLSGWFCDVTLRRYDDDLVVTEAEPLVAYVSSGMSSARSVPMRQNLAKFRDAVGSALAKDGRIRITKDVGMFVANGPKGRQGTI